MASRGEEWGEEVNRVARIAAPMVVVTSSQYLLQIISVMMVGHLGELSLSSTAMAVSLASVSGFSLLVVFNFVFTYDSGNCHQGIELVLNYLLML
ncbi:hypothetical protein NL676_032033 [Syzygium grande]|nr:hypothetical protein NL676_032033 [Syzygium grande]